MFIVDPLEIVTCLMLPQFGTFGRSTSHRDSRLSYLPSLPTFSSVFFLSLGDLRIANDSKKALQTDSSSRPQPLSSRSTQETHHFMANCLRLT